MVAQSSANFFSRSKANIQLSSAMELSRIPVEVFSTMPEDDRTAQLKEEIRARLRGVCSNLPEASFEELVQKIADQARKSLTPDRPASGKQKRGEQELSGAVGTLC